KNCARPGASPFIATRLTCWPTTISLRSDSSARRPDCPPVYFRVQLQNSLLRAVFAPGAQGPSGPRYVCLFDRGRTGTSDRGFHTLANYTFNAAENQVAYQTSCSPKHRCLWRPIDEISLRPFSH